MTPDLTWKRFAAAAELLASSGSMKERLFAAYRNELASLDIENLPAELRADYSRWHAKLHSERPLRGEDAVRATLRKLSGKEADRLAQTLVKLSIRLMQIAPPNNAPVAEMRLASTANGSVVRLFPGQ